MDEVKIRSGTRVKLRKVDEGELPDDFVSRLKELAHRFETVQAVYAFGLDTDKGSQLALALGIKTGFFGKTEDEFLRVVDEVQLLLPPELEVNVYRLAATPLVGRYCLAELEAIYLRSSAWRDKLLKKLDKASRA